MARIGRKQALAWIAEDFQKNRTFDLSLKL
jgi:hypothetical protein